MPEWTHLFDEWSVTSSRLLSGPVLPAKGVPSGSADSPGEAGGGPGSAAQRAAASPHMPRKTKSSGEAAEDLIEMVRTHLK
jgi:hypothetical protein